MKLWTPVDLEVYERCSIVKEDRSPAEESAEREILLAARIQHSLLGGFEQIDFQNMRIFGGTVPSREVGGDFYDAYSPCQGRLDIVLGDVMGKGVQAALLGASIRTRLYRSLFELYRDSAIVAEPAAEPAAEPEQKNGAPPSIPAILSALDDSLRAELLEMHQFATLVYARLDMGNLRLDYSDCGHTAFCLVEAGSTTVWNIKGSNMPLGFSDSCQDYLEYSIPLSSGDMLLFYSDGLSDVTDEHGIAFGQENIEVLLAERSAVDPIQAGRSILREAILHSGASPSDDVTIILVRTGASEADAQIYTERFSVSVREDLGSFRLGLLEALKPRLKQLDDARMLEICDALTIAAVELISNIFDHADMPESSMIEILLRIDQHSVWICIEYEAESYDWFETRSPSLSDLTASYSMRGYGTQLVRELVDSFSTMIAEGPRSRIVLRKDMKV